MSIPQQTNRIRANVAVAHMVVAEMGGEQLTPTSANLAPAISSIPQGSSLTGFDGEHIVTTISDNDEIQAKLIPGSITASQIPISATTAARLGLTGASVTPMVAPKVEIAPETDELSKLKQELHDLDMQSTPYLRRSIVGTATPDDIKALTALDKKANSLQKIIKAREKQCKK